MIPHKYSVFTNIRKRCNLKTLRSKNCFFFVKKKLLNWYQMHFFWMLKKNLKRKHFAEQSHSVFKGFKGGPFKHTQTFFFLFSVFCFLFFLPFIKNTFCINWKLFSEKYAGNKKERNYWPQGLQIVVFQQSFFSNLGEKVLFWRGHWSENLLKPWIRLQVFFPE